jgi:hypothetical protein
MRLYKKVKKLLPGVTADNVNKGLLLVNTSAGTNYSVNVNVLNYDNTIATISVGVGRASPSPLTLDSSPGHTIIPFKIKNWSGNTAINGYTLY